MGIDRTILTRNILVDGDEGGDGEVGDGEDGDDEDGED